MQTLQPSQYPPLLTEIPDPPEQLYLRGTYPDTTTNTFLAVVGSRKHTDYGTRAAHTLLSSLKDMPVIIISGLALGIDGLAHEAALKAGLTTVAVPGSGLDGSVLYPRSHRDLAKKILESGGCLLSEFEPTFKAAPWSFPKRNRIMAGLSHAVLVIEAREKSGTRITARLATEYNREVLVVPGSIYSDASTGANNLIREGATPITSPTDLHEALNLEKGAQQSLFEISPHEQRVMSVLSSPQTKKELVHTLSLPEHEVIKLIESLLIKGVIVEKLGKIHLVSLDAK